MKIASVTYRLARNRLSNSDLIEYIRQITPHLNEAEFGLLAKRINIGFKLTGSQYRYRHMNRTDVTAHVVDAARQALEAAHLAPRDVSVIIYVGVGRGCLEPATAALVQKRLGAVNATSFDVLDACVSWVRGLQIAQALMKTSGYANVLLVNCEMGMDEYGVSDELTADNLDLYFSGLTLSEAATACVLQPGGEDFEFHCRTFPEGFGYCMIPMANAASFVAGEVPEEARPGKFLALSTQLVNTGLHGIETVYFDAGLDKTDPPELTLIHSVSEKASKAALNRIGLAWDRHFDIHASHGNCVSASIPLGICLAREAGRLRPGMDTLLIGAGAGVSVGLCRFRFA